MEVAGTRDAHRLGVETPLAMDQQLVGRRMPVVVHFRRVAGPELVLQLFQFAASICKESGQHQYSEGPPCIPPPDLRAT